MRKSIVFMIMTLSFRITLCFAQQGESTIITTYYPSPYGSYNELTTFSNTYLATESGNVGIGTLNPNYKLEVNGDIMVRGSVFYDLFPGDMLWSANDDLRSINKGSGGFGYTKIKETRIGQGGAFRIRFEGRGFVSMYNSGSYARIYRNGSPVGQEWELPTAQAGPISYRTISEDIGGWKAGDFVQVYVRARLSGGEEGVTVYVQNFRLYVNYTSSTTNTPGY